MESGNDPSWEKLKKPSLTRKEIEELLLKSGAKKGHKTGSMSLTKGAKRGDGEIAEQKGQ
jgi:hypothetical protein